MGLRTHGNALLWQTVYCCRVEAFELDNNPANADAPVPATLLMLGDIPGTLFCANQPPRSKKTKTPKHFPSSGNPNSPPPPPDLVMASLVSWVEVALYHLVLGHGMKGVTALQWWICQDPHFLQVILLCVFPSSFLA